MDTPTSSLPVLLPDSSRLSVESVRHVDGAVAIVAFVTGDTASCPLCGVCSGHVHSRYGRTLRDLPLQGVSVRLSLRTRRFYCQSGDCRRKIFTERFPSLTASYSRQTNRHREALKQIGYALGGEAGFRLASQLGVDSSSDTILRMVKENACPVANPHVRVLGVDDWAWRKGQSYGTILVDLERHQPIDLLPDRESTTLEKWLKGHPEVEVISRDRAGAYAEGARNGAPAAMQVADRFHILCNLTQALQRLLERLAGTLRQVQPSELPPPAAPPSDSIAAQPNDSSTSAPGSDPVTLNRHELQSHHRRERRKVRYEAVRDAYQRGLTQRAIAQQFGLSRRTVRRFLQAVEFPEQAPRPRQTGLELYRGYLEKRWAEGCHNAARLWRELREQGYTGQASRVKEFLQPWRSQLPKLPPRSRKLPGLRLVAFWLTKPAAQRQVEEQQWVQTVTKDQPDVAMAENLAQEFRDLFRDRRPGGLDQWLEAVQASAIPELQGFAAGIRRDHDAVAAGIGEAWSNGQVEGQVHRLKLLKRQMYGRSGFVLLRRRVLPFKTTTEPRLPRSP